MAAEGKLIDMNEEDRLALENKLSMFPDFPKAGISFYDVFPIFADAASTATLIFALAKHCESLGVEAIVGVESRGFLFAQLAYALRLPFIPVRKAGKLPGASATYTYSTEYSNATVEMRAGLGSTSADKPTKVIIADDLLATGGTLAAACHLCEKVHFNVVGALVLVELNGLGGAGVLPVPLYTVLKK